MRRALRLAVLALSVLCLPARAQAEWQLKPFAGLTFGGDTTFVDWDLAAGSRKLAIGGSAAWEGNIFGVEFDVGRTPGYFDGNGGPQDRNLILSSQVTTVTGNLIVGVPKSIARYTLRPYLVVGAGSARVTFDDALEVLPLSKSLSTMAVGGGVTGMLSDSVGVNWDVRYFRTLRAPAGTVPETLGRPARLSFWRATMGLTIRP